MPAATGAAAGDDAAEAVGALALAVGELLPVVGARAVLVTGVAGRQPVEGGGATAHAGCLGADADGETGATGGGGSTARVAALGINTGMGAATTTAVSGEPRQ